jgi:hypothetical protein
MATCPDGKAHDQQVTGRNADTAHNPIASTTPTPLDPAALTANTQQQLTAAVTEMDRRAAVLADLPPGERLHQWPGAQVVVLVDEAHTMLADPQIRDLLNQLVRMGRQTDVNATLGFRHPPALADFGGDPVIREIAAAGTKPIRTVVAGQLPPLDPHGLATSTQFTDGTWRDADGRTLFDAIKDRLGATNATNLWTAASQLHAAAHAEATSQPMPAALVVRLAEIADDPSWPVTLRITAQAAAAGDPHCRIAPASLRDEDIRAALIADIYRRRDLPASVDIQPSGGDVNR